MSKEGKAAFLDMIKDGELGFAAFHCGSDTFHSPKHTKGDLNFLRTTGGLDPYIQMLGGEFVIHGSSEIQASRHRHQVPRPLSADVEIPAEEWYSLKNFVPDLHVILVQDTAGMEGAMYQRKPYPETWAAHARQRPGLLQQPRPALGTSARAGFPGAADRRPELGHRPGRGGCDA